MPIARRAQPKPVTGSTTMAAIVHDAYGSSPEGVLRAAEVPQPVVREDQLLVRVHAASIDRGTWHIMAGLPYPIRLAGFGFRRPKHLNPGRAFAGTVEAVGVAATGFTPGDAVYGSCDGSFAEYVAARPAKVALKPANLTFAEAAAMPISATTALQAVRDHGKVRPGERVLVIGASGGVGSFAVQLAKAFGAVVTGVCSTAKVDLVRSLGADEVIDYTRSDFAGVGRRYDVILDIGGNRRLKDLRRVLTERGRLVIVGGETDGRWLGGTDRQLRAHLLSPFVSQQLGTFVAKERAEDLVALRELAESGKVRPVVDRTFPLAEVPAAIRYLVDGKAAGKISIAI